MAAQGLQLTTFLYGLYFGRRKMPALVAPLAPADPSAWALGTSEGPVEIAGQCRAVQIDGTTCGSAAIALAQASDPASVQAQALAPSDADVAEQFAQLQRSIKAQTNKRAFGIKWPQAWGTPPWGASREMSFAGHDYFDRMVVDTSLPQSTRVLTHAARCALNGFPVLLYVGGDTSMSWAKSVPRHVVVLHSPPAPIATETESAAGVGGEFGADAGTELGADAGAESGTDAGTESGTAQSDLDIEAQMEQRLAELERKIQAKLAEARSALEEPEFNPELFIYEPSQGINTKVTLRQLIDKECPPQAIGGWRHVMWAVMPKAQTEAPPAPTEAPKAQADAPHTPEA